MDDKQTLLSTLFEEKIISFLKANDLTVQDLRTTESGKAKRNQPDIYCEELGYFEPTVARCDKDGFSELEYNAPVWNSDTPHSPVFGCVPQEIRETQQSLLASRIINRLNEKESNIKRYYEEKTIKHDEPCFVCLTIDTDGFSNDYFYEDFIEDTLTRTFYQINTNEMEVSQDGSWYKIITKSFNKPNLEEREAPLETGLFIFLGNKDIENNTTIESNAAVENIANFENIAGVIFVIPKPIRTSDNANWTYDCLHGERVEYTSKDIFFFGNTNAKILLGEERMNIIKRLKFKKNYM